MNNKELCKELNEVIEGSGASYGEVISALRWLLVAYEDKGENLLNAANIQEVSKMAQSRSVKLPH